MADVKFTYEGLDIIIRCNKNQKMRDICTYLSTKINVNINSLIFLYGGTQLNLEKTFKELTKENKISILVDKYKNEEICPKCGKILNNDIINEIISSYNKINSSLKEIKRQI
jgi:superfamily II helicase